MRSTACSGVRSPPCSRTRRTAADAAVELVKAGGQKSHGFGASSSIYVFADGGMLLDLAIGGQKLIFKPAAELGKATTAEGGVEKAPVGEQRERTDEEHPAAEEEERPRHHPG